MSENATQASAEALVVLLTSLLQYRVTQSLPKVSLQKYLDDAAPFCLQFRLDYQALSSATKSLGTQSFERYVGQFGQSMKNNEAEINATTKITVDTGKALKKARAAMLKKADATVRDVDALGKIASGYSTKVAAQIGQSKEVQRQDYLFEELNAIIKKFFPKQPKNLFLNGAQSTELKQIDAKVHRRYLDLRKMILDIAASSQFRIVSESGDATMDAQEVRAKQKEMGVVRSAIPPRFVGRVSAAPGFYTADGRKLATTSLGYDTVMNPEWTTKDDVYYCSYNTQMGTRVVTTEEFQKRSSANRFEVVQFVMDNLPEAREKWRADMGWKTLAQILNVMVEVVYKTSARSSHKLGNTAGETTYGTTTWLVKQVEVTPAKIENGKLVPGQIDITYPGKKNQIQHHIIRPDSPAMRIVYATILKLRDGKKPDDYLWTFHGRRITADETNKHMKELFGNDEVTLHKFRHARGTAIAQSILATEYPFDPSSAKRYTQDDVTRWFKSQMLRVGEVLGHYNGGQVTWRTAVENYVAPQVSKEFFSRAEVRVADEIANAIKNAAED